jgi:hypothetical protein
MTKRIKSLRIKINAIIYAVLITIGIFQSMNIHAQTNINKTIHVIRERKFLGSGNKMDIQINGKSVFKLKNGRHLIVNSHNNQLDFQIIYPFIKRFKSKIWHFTNENESEIYLLVSYRGIGEYFRIEIKQLSLEEGKVLLKNSKRYKKKTDEIEI